jgi:hypothetical protein
MREREREREHTNPTATWWFNCRDRVPIQNISCYHKKPSKLLQLKI